MSFNRQAAVIITNWMAAYNCFASSGKGTVFLSFGYSSNFCIPLKNPIDAIICELEYHLNTATV